MKVLVVISCILAVSAAAPWAGYPLAYQAHPYSYGGHTHNYNPYTYGSYLYGGHAHGPYNQAYAYGSLPAHVPAVHGYKPTSYNYQPSVHAYQPAYAPYAPAYGVSHQYHSQNSLGGYTYGYNDGLSSKKESSTPHGTVGSYSYVDANGKHQTVSYVADAGGFRVKATNLPVAPNAPEAKQVAGPEPVEDTAEVKAAKEQFKKLYDEAAEAADAAPDTAEETHRYRRSALPKPVDDTPAVKAAKAKHAYLYNKAAAAAAAAPDHGYGYNGYGGYFGYGAPHLYNHLGYQGHQGYHGVPNYFGHGAPYHGHGFSYAYSTPLTAPNYLHHHY